MKKVIRDLQKALHYNLGRTILITPKEINVWSEKRQKPIEIIQLREDNELLLSTSNQGKIIQFLAEEYKKGMNAKKREEKGGN